MPVIAMEIRLLRANGFVFLSDQGSGWWPF